MITPEDPTYASMYALKNNLDTLKRVMEQSTGHPTMSLDDVKLSIVTLYMIARHLEDVHENLIVRMRRIEREIGL